MVVRTHNVAFTRKGSQGEWWRACRKGTFFHAQFAGLNAQESGGQLALQQMTIHCLGGSPCAAAMKDYALVKRKHAGSSVTFNREREPQRCE